MDSDVWDYVFKSSDKFSGAQEGNDSDDRLQEKCKEQKKELLCPGCPVTDHTGPHYCCNAKGHNRRNIG